MKRLTIAMDDELYARLLRYAADQSKRKSRRISLGETVRTLVSVGLDDVEYPTSVKSPRGHSKTRA